MMTSEEFNSYAVLGLRPGASAREVKEQFRRLAKRFHPDLNAGSAWHQEQFRRVHAAYEVIGNIRRADAFVPPLEAVGAEVAWVHVGEPVHTAGTPFRVEIGPSSKRRHGARPYARRVPIAGVITWGLAAIAFLLVMVVMAGPHTGAGALASPTSHQGVSPPLSSFGLPPPAGILPSAGIATASEVTSPQSAAFPDRDRVSATPMALESRGLGPASRTYPLQGAEFSVDAKYTHVDPAYTTVDPALTSIDPRLTHP